MEEKQTKRGSVDQIPLTTTDQLIANISDDFNRDPLGWYNRINQGTVLSVIKMNSNDPSQLKDAIRKLNNEIRMFGLITITGNYSPKFGDSAQTLLTKQIRNHNTFIDRLNKRITALEV